MAKKTAKTNADNVVQGENQKKDVVEQTMEARGIDPGAKHEVDPGSSGSAASKPPLTPEMKARDQQIKEREEYLRDNGIDPDTDRNFGGANLKKVEKADVKGKQYRGLVTCTSVHGQTHEKISARIDLPTASGEEYVWYAFKQHHPNALREEFVIDETNTDDPMLRSRYE